MRKLFLTLFAIASLAPCCAGAAHAAKEDACAARAKQAASDEATGQDATVTLVSLTKVRPTKAEVGAGDQFFDAVFTGSKSTMKFHLIMWCKGMKAPLAMAIQPRYD